MKKWVALALVVVAAAGVAAWWLAVEDAAPQVDVGAARHVERDLPALAPPPLDSTSPQVERVEAVAERGAPSSAPADESSTGSTSILLHVRDADSGEALVGVDVALPASGGLGYLEHPGPTDRLTFVARGVTSPVALPIDRLPSGGRWTLFVRATGHGWQRIEVHSEGGERQVLLRRSGDLEVSIIGLPRDPGTVLRLRTADVHNLFTRVAEVNVGTLDRVALESVPAGHYVARAELGDNWYRDSTVFAHAPLDVVADLRTMIELVLPALTTPVLVPFAGIVRVPADWQAAEVWLDGEFGDPVYGGGEKSFKEACATVAGDPESWTFDVGPSQPGHYDLEIVIRDQRAVLGENGALIQSWQAVPIGRRPGSVQVSVSVDVPSTGLPAARFEVPAPSGVAVNVVEAGTGQEVDVIGVNWYCVKPEGWSRSWSTPGANWNPTTRRHEFRAPQTAISISVNPRDHAYAERELVVQPGLNDVTIEVEKKSAIIVVLHDGESHVRWSSDFDAECEGLEGQPYRAYESYDSDIEIVMAAPGRYRLTIEGIDGYLPIPDREVLVEMGKTTRVEIALEHKP